MTDPIQTLREALSLNEFGHWNPEQFRRTGQAFTQVENLVRAAQNWEAAVGDNWPYPSEGANAKLRDALAPFEDTP